jgi:hypothetical protein
MSRLSALQKALPDRPGPGAELRAEGEEHKPLPQPGGFAD